MLRQSETNKTTMNGSISRRDFLKTTGGSMAWMALGGLATGCTHNEQHVPIGVQLFSVRHALAEDFEGTIARLADMGFEGVEFADYYGMTGQQIHQVLQKYNLRCCGTHVVVDALRGAQFEESVAFNKELGNQYFILRWIDTSQRDSRDSFLRTIQEYNRIVDRLAEHDMYLGYHNHDYIFEKFGEDYLWDILATNTSERFIMQLDTGHAALTGQDPVELIERYPGRTITMHAKAYSRVRPEAVIGEDELDWEGIVQTAETVGGTQWHILEYEIPNVPPLEALQATITNFKRIQRG